MSGAIRLDVDTEQAELFAQSLRTASAFAEDMAKRAGSWIDSVEAGEMDADEMWHAIRVLRDQTDLVYGQLVKAHNAIEEQIVALRRALGW